MREGMRQQFLGQAIPAGFGGTGFSLRGFSPCQYQIPQAEACATVPTH
jgi:hypothetical protein